MQLNDVLNSAADQERGAWLDLLDPVTWQPTGIKLRIAGPDSATARRARLKMADDLAELAGPDGRVTAEHRETCRKTCLARSPRPDSVMLNSALRLLLFSMGKFANWWSIRQFVQPKSLIALLSNRIDSTGRISIKS